MMIRSQGGAPQDKATGHHSFGKKHREKVVGNKIFTGVFVLISVLAVVVAVIKFNPFGERDKKVIKQEAQVVYYTCGMHPEVKVSPKEYNRGNKLCPSCNMKLTSAGGKKKGACCPPKKDRK